MKLYNTIIKFDKILNYTLFVNVIFNNLNLNICYILHFKLKKINKYIINKFIKVFLLDKYSNTIFNAYKIIIYIFLINLRIFKYFSLILFNII